MARALACWLALVLFQVSVSAQQIESGQVQGFGPQGPIGQSAPSQPATGRSAIRGRVIAVETGQPVRRATVRIAASELRVPRLILTDADGRYEFSSLPAGRYSISVSKSPLVSWSYGQTQPGSPGRPLVIGDNQVVDNVNVSMPRGGVITGRITDEFGEPAPNARVMLMRQQFRRGERTLMPGGAIGTTNDIGEYRLFGLSPGSYFLSAIPSQQGIVAGPAAPMAGTLEGDEARNGYAPTFYPGTPFVASAQRVTVVSGQTLSEINLVLQSARTATISGVAVDAQGNPLCCTFIQVMPRNGTTGLGTPGAALRQDGAFRIPNIPPGDYVLRANLLRPQQQAGPPAGPPEWALAFVSVNGEDLEDVRIAPIPRVSITGRVIFDDQAAAQSLNPSAVRVLTLAETVGDAGLGIGSGGAPLPVNDDFTFDLKTTPGQMAIRAVAAGWQMKAIRVDGMDITDEGLDVRGEGVSGVDIEMTNRLQEVSGTVSDANGNGVGDYIVVIFARDRALWTAALNRYGATSRPGNDGRFKVTTLPEGDYYAIALDRTDSIEGQDPEFLDGLSRLASPFSLTRGETRMLELKLFTVQ